MRIGVPREIKTHEYRVGLTPDNIAALAHAGHQCRVQTQAGQAIGFSDADYQAAGASVVQESEPLYSWAELIVKVKEPQPDEISLLRRDQLLFCYLHLAASKTLTEKLRDTGVIGIAYETITQTGGGLPLLAPMSEVAGRYAVQAGLYHLTTPQGGRGILLGGVPGVAPARVVIIGGGVVGTQAARMAVGLGAQVIILDKQLNRLRQLDELFNGRVQTLAATEANIQRAVIAADLVVGAVLVSGAAAPKVVNRAMIAEMQPGAVVVDVAIDQGGCFETSKPTTHDQPTYRVDNVIHYCVANIPGAVARTATLALTNATFPYVQRLADAGAQALLDDQHFLQGVNLAAGQVCCQPVAESLQLPWTAATELLPKQLSQR